MQKNENFYPHMGRKVETAPIGNMRGSVELWEPDQGCLGLIFPGGDGWRRTRRSTVAVNSCKSGNFMTFSDFA